mmetsp:Transcript_7653/g.15596  ORF Transcript_7653/g.15596 Transcript_7653/m.15596 type:complete len:249 (-) Transcript_7653:359-1105(-)
MLYWTSNHSMFESRSRNGDVVTFCALNLNASSIASIVIGCNDCDGDAFSSTVVSTFSTLFSTLSSIFFSTPLTSLAPPNKASKMSSDKKSTSIQGKTTPFLLKPGPSISCSNIANKLLARLYLSCSSNKQAASIAAAASRICLTASSLPVCNICSSFGRTPKSKITSSLILLHRFSRSSSSSSKRVNTAITRPATTCISSSCSSRVSCSSLCHSSTDCCATFPQVSVTSHGSMFSSSSKMRKCIFGKF